MTNGAAVIGDDSNATSINEMGSGIQMALRFETVEKFNTFFVYSMNLRIFIYSEVNTDLRVQYDVLFVVRSKQWAVQRNTAYGECT